MAQILNLRASDVYVLLKQTANMGTPLAQAKLAKQLHITASTVNESLNRAHLCGLYNPRRQAVNVGPFLEFLQHGIKYVFPSIRGPLTRGVPTSYGAPPLVELLTAPTDWLPVWAHPTGSERGYEVIPLHANAPIAALEDPAFYQLLALTDTMREKRARESMLALAELEKRFDQYGKSILS
jgi:hypothetical protein